MAQDAVSGGQVEIEVGQDEAQQIGSPGEVDFLVVGLEHDGALLAAVDLLRRHPLQEGHGLGEAFLQLVKAGFGIGITRHLDTSQTRGTALGRVGDDLHLTHQRKHVGSEPGVKEDFRGDFPRGGMGGSLGEDGRQTIQTTEERRDGGLVHGEGHVLIPGRGIGQTPDPGLQERRAARR
ncbi:hypothetical protein D3C80_1381390 [compost metagenome]